jgi:hypothetical protein
MRVESSRTSSAEDVSTTMIYTHVLNLAGVVWRSPLDQALGTAS